MSTIKAVMNICDSHHFQFNLLQLVLCGVFSFYQFISAVLNKSHCKLIVLEGGNGEESGERLSKPSSGVFSIQGIVYLWFWNTLFHVSRQCKIVVLVQAHMLLSRWLNRTTFLFFFLLANTLCTKKYITHL